MLPNPVYIPKDSGGRRPLGIPPVLDRVIEQALAQVMEPLFDPEFSEFSYADDFLVLVKSERAGQRVMASLTRFLERKLRLAVNPQKSQVAKLNQCRFLGFTFRGKKIVWSEKSIAARVTGTSPARWQRNGA